MPTQYLPYIFLGVVIIISMITFLAYAYDKHQAKHRGWRVPEKVLLSLSLLGGAIGGALAMKMLRHKTKKEHWYFSAVNTFGILLHLAVFIILLISFAI